MKTFYATLFLAGISFFSAAQSFVWCPPGAQWHYDIDYFALTGYVDLKYVSDTIVEGRSCKKLLECSESYDQMLGTSFPYTCTSYRLTYDSNSVVYGLGYNNSWDTLFDFNATPGHQWHLFLGDPNEIVQVQDTGHMIVQNLNLKWMTVTYPNSLAIITDTILERVGCINFNYPFNPSVESSDPEIHNFCNYSDNQFSDWRHTDSYCTFLPTGIVEQNSQVLFRVYPNPADDEITVSALQTGVLSATDGISKVPLNLAIKNNRAVVSTKNLAGGIYFLTFQTTNGCETKKIIIHH